MITLTLAMPVAARDAAAPWPLDLPRDEAPHDVATEWWYFTGHLTSDDGRLYGFQLVFFRAKRSGLKGVVAHAAVTDTRVGRFAYDQRAELDTRDADQEATTLLLALGNWQIGGADGTYMLMASVPGYSYRLRLVSTKPAVLHTGDGYVLGATGQPSYYYSRTRLLVIGTLTAGNKELAVRGQAWMDHQWGNFINLSAAEWDWLALQLDDGRDLMAFYFRDQAGRRHFGASTLVDADGSSRSLAAEQITLTPMQTWRSPSSGATYPIAWRLTVAGADLDVFLTATVMNQELDTRRTTGLTYWEGQAMVYNTEAKEQPVGLAYLELTGYARERDGAVP
jgi:predicted secreted hydrolase